MNKLYVYCANSEGEHIVEITDPIQGQMHIHDLRNLSTFKSKLRNDLSNYKELVAQDAHFDCLIAYEGDVDMFFNDEQMTYKEYVSYHEGLKIKGGAMNYFYLDSDHLERCNLIKTNTKSATVEVLRYGKLVNKRIPINNLVKENEEIAVLSKNDCGGIYSFYIERDQRKAGKLLAPAKYWFKYGHNVLVENGQPEHYIDWAKLKSSKCWTNDHFLSLDTPNEYIKILKISEDEMKTLVDEAYVLNEQSRQGIVFDDFKIND
jgi:hypothetical protein